MIKNKNTNATFAIKGIPKLSNKTMLESVDIYEYSPNPGSNRNEIVKLWFKCLTKFNNSEMTE